MSNTYLSSLYVLPKLTLTTILLKYVQEREVGGGIRMGSMCTPVVDSCMAKPIQYCKVISIQLK